MIILLDQDGVLFDYAAELYKRWADRYPEEFALHHVPLDRAPYDLTNFYTGEIRVHLKAIEDEPGFFGSLPPIPGAIDAAHEIRALGHQVCICTRPSKHVTAACAFDKIRLIREHLGDEWIERTMIVRDKTFAHGDILIDDKPQVTGAVKRPTWQHVLYDWPYNRHIDKPRLSWNMNWREVIAELEHKLYARVV